MHLGSDPGLAALYDSALLGLMWSTMTGWLHGTALVGAERTPATAFTPIAIRWLTAVTGFLTTYAPQVDARQYPGDDATVDVHQEPVRAPPAALEVDLLQTFGGDVLQLLLGGAGGPGVEEPGGRCWAPGHGALDAYRSTGRALPEGAGGRLGAVRGRR